VQALVVVARTFFRSSGHPNSRNELVASRSST
jgi:hypothetical protein